MNEQHVHRWVIEEPNGRRSPAVCRECGAEKLMENVFVGDRSPERAAWDSGGRRWNGAS